MKAFSLFIGTLLISLSITGQVKLKEIHLGSSYTKFRFIKNDQSSGSFRNIYDFRVSHQLSFSALIKPSWKAKILFEFRRDRFNGRFEDKSIWQTINYEADNISLTLFPFILSLGEKGELTMGYRHSFVQHHSSSDLRQQYFNPSRSKYLRNSYPGLVIQVGREIDLSKRVCLFIHYTHESSGRAFMKKEFSLFRLHTNYVGASFRINFNSASHWQPFNAFKKGAWGI